MNAGHADLLSVVALAKVAQLARRPGFDDSEVRESLQALRSGLDALSTSLAERIDAKADAGHGHSDLSEQIQAVRDASEAVQSALRSDLDALSVNKAGAEHEHIEYAHIAKVDAEFSAVMESLEALQEQIAAVAGEEAQARQALAEQTKAAQSQAVESVEALARVSGQHRAELARAIASKADQGHGHADLSDQVTELGQALRAGLAGKAQARHGHADIERTLTDLAALLSRKADADHGEHLSAEQVAAMVRQARPRDGADGESIKPMGDYIGGHYKALSLIRHNKATWLSIVDTDEAPTERSKSWQLIAKDGKAGDKGQMVLRARTSSAGNGMKFDDYEQAEHLEEITGDGTVQTLTFSARVQFIVAEMVSTLDEDTQAAQIDAQEGRVIAGGEAPTTTKGAIMKHEQPVTLLVTTDTVKILTVSNARFNVYGMRRSAV